MEKSTRPAMPRMSSFTSGLLGVTVGWSCMALGLVEYRFQGVEQPAPGERLDEQGRGAASRDGFAHRRLVVRGDEDHRDGGAARAQLPRELDAGFPRQP